MIKLKDFCSRNKKTIRPAVLIFFLIFIFYFIISPFLSFLKISRGLPEKLKLVKLAFDTQDFTLLEFELEYLREDLVEIEKNSGRLKIFSIVPYFGSYFKDLNTFTSLSVDLVDTSISFFGSLERSIPALDFTGWGFTEDLLEDSSGTSLTDVSGFLINELPKYKDRFSVISDKFNSLNPEKYPKSVRGISVRQYLGDIQLLLSGLTSSFDDVVYIVSLIPDLLGEGGVKNYLVFLQNDKELRPSGGVLDAYAVFAVRKGKIRIVKSGDVLFIDDNKSSYESPSDYISKYLGVNKFLLKDSAYSADFKESAVVMKRLWDSSPDTPEVHGVVILNTHLISSLLEILGEVEINDKGIFTSENVAIKLQEFSASAGSHLAEDKEQKDIIGAFLFELLRQVFSAPPVDRAEIFKRVLVELRGKHILAYFKNTEVQNLIEKHELGGLVKDYNLDYLYISEANVGRDKSNLYINEKVNKSVFKRDGKFISKVDVEYENTGSFDEVLNKGLKNYIKVYVPRGSQLLSSNGLSDLLNDGIEFGKTYFAGYLEVLPEFKASFSLEYELPENITFGRTYNLLIQKQPGLDKTKYNVTYKDFSESFKLEKDKEVMINL